MKGIYWDKIQGSKYETYISKNSTRGLAQIAMALLGECDSIVVGKSGDDIIITLKKFKEV